jgi:hypothetical protein
MAAKRFFVLFIVLGFVSASAAGGWYAGRRIVTPAEAAARTAPPTPSPILVPVESRQLGSKIVTRGTARFGMPQQISIAPSTLKAKAGLVSTLPLRSTTVNEGDVLLTASGRPVLVFKGAIPAYRDLVPGISGNDVRQLEEALQRLGFPPGPVDGTFDAETSAAVAQCYEAGGWEPFGPTAEQVAAIRVLEASLADATKSKLTADAAVEAAELGVRAAQATAEHKIKVAAADVEAKMAAQNRIKETENDEPLPVMVARANAVHAEKAALAEISTRISEDAVLRIDPRAPNSAKTATTAQLNAARAALDAAKLQGELAIRTAERDAKLAKERDAKLAAEQLDLAQAAHKAAQMEAEAAIKLALNAQKSAEFDARLAADRLARIASDLEIAKYKTGVQLPADEIAFIANFPVRVEDIKVLVGETATGHVLTLTDNQLAIDSLLRLHEAPLVKPGTEVLIDESSLGIKAMGVVEWVANTPGTRGADAYHFYCEIRVTQTPIPLQGYSLRLTIPTDSSKESVTAVPISALTLTADGRSRVQTQEDGELRYIFVEPGLVADGFVEVTALDGSLKPGQLVVVGQNNNESNEAL